MVAAILVTGGYGEVIMAAVGCASWSSAVGGCCAGAVVVVGIAIAAVAVSAVVVVI